VIGQVLFGLVISLAFVARMRETYSELLREV
jgi:hypothetical protein